jgi:hypothetical protein
VGVRSDLDRRRRVQQRLSLQAGALQDRPEHGAAELALGKVSQHEHQPTAQQHLLCTLLRKQHILARQQKVSLRSQAARPALSSLLWHHIREGGPCTLQVAVLCAVGSPHLFVGFHLCYAGGCHLSNGRVGKSKLHHAGIGQHMPWNSIWLKLLQKALQLLLQALSICISGVHCQSTTEGNLLTFLNCLFYCQHGNKRRKHCTCR